MAKGKKSADELKQVLDGINEDVADIGLGIKLDLIDKLKNATKEAKLLANITGQDLLQALNSVAKSTTQIESNEEKLAERGLKSKDVAKQMATLKKEQADAILKVAKAEKTGYLTQAASKIMQEQIVDLTEKQTEELQLQYIQAVKQEKVNKSNLKYQERLEKVFSGIAKIPLLGSLINVGKIMEKVKKTAEDGGGKIKQLLAGFGEMGKQLVDPFALATVAITGLFSLFKALFKMALEFDQKIYDAAKNLGVSVREAERLYGKFQAIAASGMNLGLQAKDIVKTYGELNDQLGFMVPSSAAFAGNMTLIQKRIGASAADMEALATASAYTGTSVKSTYGTLVGTAKVEAARNGFMMTNRQILDAVAKTSKTVLMNFGGNVKELVKSIVQAKKLGTTLEDIEKKGQGMLNFEDSISKEFEFQALTGSKIDLSRARQLAQLRKMPELMAELNKQGLSFREWNSKGAIEQQSYAELMSTSVEELNKMYNQQKLITVLGEKEGVSLAGRYKTLMKTVEGREKIAASLSKEEQADLARASANEEWEATLQRIKDLLGSILRGPVIEIVHTVAGWLNNTKLVHEFGMKVKNVFSGIADFIKGIPGYIEKIPNVLNKIITLAKLWFSLSIGIAAANAAASMSTVPGVGPLVGIAAGLAMYGALSALVPDFAESKPSIAASTQGSINPMNTNAAAAKNGNELAKSQRAVGESTTVTKLSLNIAGKPIQYSVQESQTQDNGNSFDKGTGKANGSGTKTN